jgi:hypothetical protein
MLQYKLFFNTTSERLSPIIKSIRIRYNLLHTISIINPNEDDTWTGSKGITWDISDPDKDSFAYDIYLLDKAGGRQPIVSDYSTLNKRYDWNTDTVRSGKYKIQIFAKDDNRTIPLVANCTSDWFFITHPNNPPRVDLVRPEYAQSVNSSSVTLEWNGTDVDDDSLEYRVYLDTIEFDFGSLPEPYGSTKETSMTITNLTDRATYYWSVLPFDGKDNGSLPDPWVFSVLLPPPPPVNHPPTVELLSPWDNTTVNSLFTELDWKGTDRDHDALTYRVYLRDGPFDLPDLPAPACSTADTRFNATNLNNSVTYYWTVIANDGELYSTNGPVWKFRVNIVIPPDTPRVIDFSPKGTKTPLNPTLLITFDRDMDLMSVASSLSSSPSLDVASFMRSDNNKTITFTLGSQLLPETTYKVVVGTTAKATNGKFMFLPFRWNFTTIAPGEIDSELPTVLFTDPPDKKSNVDKWTNITIMFSKAMDMAATERLCTISPPVNGSWPWMNNRGFAIQFKPVSGFANGTYRVTIINTARDESGNPLDGNGNGKADGSIDDFTFSFTVGAPLTGKPRLMTRSFEGKGVRTDAALVLAFDRAMNLSAVKAAFWMVPAIEGVWTMDSEGKIFTFTPSNEFRASTRYTVTVSRTASDIEGNGLEKDESWTFTTVAAAAPVGIESGMLVLFAAIIFVAAALAGFAYMMKRKAAPAQGAGSGPATAGSSRDFAIEEIFLMYNDGRLILHTTRRIKADMDVDVFASMLTAMQAFVKDSFGKESSGELGSMEFGGSKVLFEKGKRIIIAAVITGGEPAGFRDEMKSAVKNIESEYATLLTTWDGDASLFTDAKRFLSQLGAYKVAEEMPGEKPKADVSIRSEVEFYQGFVRLKVAVKNNMPTVIMNATFELIYDEETLKLYSVEPEYETKGDRVVFGIIEPREKKTVAFNLDPQICSESYLEGILSFKDAHGNLETLKMPRKLTSVVCPILFTDENINTAMLKRMASDELDKKDSKVFTIPDSLATQRAFEIGKAAVQHHDVRLVRELKTEKPFHAEAWYYGKAKGRPERLIVRVRIIAEMNFLEFFVASDSVLMLTGMLAELKSDLNKELVNQKMPGSMKQVTSQDDMDAVMELRTMLETIAADEGKDGTGEKPGLK